MARNKKNMLEAFRASAIEGHTPSSSQQEESDPAGPFAGPGNEPPMRSSTERLATTSWFSLAPDGPLLRSAPLIGGILLLAVVALYLLGRDDGGTVEAGGPVVEEVSRKPAEKPEPREVPAKSPVVVDAPTTELPSDSTPDDLAFYDKENKYTIRAIQYRNDDRGQDLAEACYEYLRSEGFPAIWPIEQGNALILYIGASSDAKKLERIAEQVSKLRGPPPLSRQGEFKSAFRVNIDSVIVR